jgi:replicative DNA helicase
MQKFSETKEQLILKNYLPHNFLAEKMILSCLVISSEAIEITLQTLSIEAFYFNNHREIYIAISSMYKNKTPIDILTLNSFLQDSGMLETIGGVKVLIELLNQIPNLVYLEEYIRLVNDKFLRRSLIKLGYEAMNSGYITNIPLENILNDLENQLFSLTNEIKTQKVSNSPELLKDIFLELKASQYLFLNIVKYMYKNITFLA